ncbi:Fc.00g020630.m01.CDS01 [Cosmosporella sp. VM-42]
MPESKIVRPPVRMELKPAPASRSHLHDPKAKFRVEIKLLGAPDQEVLQVNLTGVPRPFLEPNMLKQD